MRRSDRVSDMREAATLSGHPCLPELCRGPQGLLFVLSGPSGVGKDTVISAMKQQSDTLHFAVTLTTRPRRSNEVDGVDYRFVSPEEFAHLQRSGALLESAVVHGYQYGTPRDQVLTCLRGGKDVILKIDVQGAEQIKRRLPNAILIFLTPPSIDELVRRLMSRHTESLEEQARRAGEAYQEMRHLPEYDYVVVNRRHKVLETVQRVMCIILAERSRVRPRRIAL